MAKKGTGETNNSEENEEKEHILPKWLRILLMFIPALVYFGIILLVDYTIGFPEPINPIAITALTGAGLFGLLVIGDMLYRNIFVYRMLAQEAQKSREQKEQLKDKQIEKEVAKKFEFIEEEGAKGGEKEYENEYEYVTEDDEDYYYYKEPSEVEKETAKQKETPEEPKTTLASKPIKSYLLRGGIVSIVLVNSIVLLIASGITQIFYGGYNVNNNETVTGLIQNLLKKRR